MLCTNPACGRPVAADQAFCGECGTRVTSSTGAFRPAEPPVHAVETTAPSGYSAPRVLPPAAPAVPRPTVETATSELHRAHGEVVKAVYPITDTQRMLGTVTGRLIVTDARIIYRAEAKNVLNTSSISQEIQLQDVNGISLLTSKGMSPTGACWLVLLSLFLALPSLFLLGASAVIGLIGLVTYGVVATIVFAGSRHTQLVFGIKTREGGATPILISTQLRGAIGGLLLLTVFPLVKLLEVLGVTTAGASDFNADYDGTKAMYDEIGALILDLQSRGALGAAS